MKWLMLIAKTLLKFISTRVTCVATKGGQTTMESYFWRKHIAKYALEEVVNLNRKSILQNYGEKTVKETNEVAKNISALVLVSKDDPLFLCNME